MVIWVIEFSQKDSYSSQRGHTSSPKRIRTYQLLFTRLSPADALADKLWENSTIKLKFKLVVAFFAIGSAKRRNGINAVTRSTCTDQLEKEK